MLATSRAPLGVGGETDWRVPPLSLPGFRATEPTESLVGSDAVELFAERARKVRPSFAVTDENAELVARICSSWMGCRWRSSSRPPGSGCSRWSRSRPECRTASGC